MIYTIGLYVLYAVGGIAALLIFLVASILVARYCGWFGYYVFDGYETARIHATKKNAASS